MSGNDDVLWNREKVLIFIQLHFLAKTAKHKMCPSQQHFLVKLLLFWTEHILLASEETEGLK